MSGVGSDVGTIRRSELARHNREGISPVYGDGRVGPECEYVDGVLKTKFVGGSIGLTPEVEINFNRYQVVDDTKGTGQELAEQLRKAEALGQV